MNRLLLTHNCFFRIRWPLCKAAVIVSHFSTALQEGCASQGSHCSPHQGLVGEGLPASPKSHLFSCCISLLIIKVERFVSFEISVYISLAYFPNPFMDSHLFFKTQLNTHLCQEPFLATCYFSEAGSHIYFHLWISTAVCVLKPLVNYPFAVYLDYLWPLLESSL